ncbi:MAG: N-acetylneuraminate lyase [Sodalis sp.]|nr:MAG: N-acetylneuraminate lyase [Sodalis sp.]
MWAVPRVKRFPAPCRAHVLDVVAKEAKGKLTLIAHFGAVSTHEIQQLAQAACRYGFDAISVVTPFYYLFSFHEHCEHYRAITDAANRRPMVVYNIPSLSGVTFMLAQDSHFSNATVALKRTSGDLFQMQQIRRGFDSL